MTLPGGNSGAGSHLSVADIKGALAPFLGSAGTGGGNIGSLLGGLRLDAAVEAHTGGGPVEPHGLQPRLSKGEAHQTFVAAQAVPALNR